MNSDYQIMQSKLLLQKGMSLEQLQKQASTAREQANNSTLEPARHQGIKLPEIKRPSSQMRVATPTVMQSPAQSVGIGSGGAQGQSGPATIKATMSNAKSSTPPMSTDELFKKWADTGNNDALKSELLDKLISEN